MRVIIVGQPRGTLEGLSLRKYRVGQTYDVPASLGAYLVAEGYALVEMRSDRNPQCSPDGDRRGKLEM